jgi:hypothetical protein
MDSAGTFANLKVLSASGTCLELIALGDGTCKLKPDSRKQIRRLEN